MQKWSCRKMDWLIRGFFILVVIGLFIRLWEYSRTLASLVLLLIFAITLNAIWEYSRLLASLVLLLTFAVTVSVFNGYRERRKDVNKTVQDVVARHAQALHVKKLQKARRDDYGNLLEEGWIKEKNYFHNSVIVPHLTKAFDQNAAKSYDSSSTASLIESAVADYERRHSLKDLDISRLTPYEFEAYCARLLKDAGWSARATQGSGDQGIDVIGERDGVKAVFQVKMYSSPVGNKAVQEVIAGKAFASADLAYVVSNTGYTPSAKDLANKSGVKLLHYSELSRLHPYSSTINTIDAGTKAYNLQKVRQQLIRVIASEVNSRLSR